jgi:hypothetical protein
MTEPEQLLDELRPLAFAIAYRMLSSVSEAEDIRPGGAAPAPSGDRGLGADPVAPSLRRQADRG